MFIHNFIYGIRCLLKTKVVLFWTLIFPMALATFMNLAFGNIYESEEIFHAIPVAMIEKNDNKDFETVIDSMSTGDDALLKLVDVTSEEEAKKMLKKGDLVGIFYEDKSISLCVYQEGLKQTILSTFLAQYEQNYKILAETISTQPDKINEVMNTIMGDTNYYNEVAVSKGNQDNLVNYYYAIFAMTCMMAAYAGALKSEGLQANTSPLGMRRCLSPKSKFSVICAEFSGTLLIQFIFEVIAFCYMKFVLGVDFGNKVPAILLLLLMGTGLGVSIGMIVGSIHQLNSNGRTAVISAISMGTSIMADLVVAGIRNLIEHSVPLVNRINPASLIVDSFYALNVYDTYDRYFNNLIILGSMTVVMIIISFLLVRRVRYANL